MSRMGKRLGAIALLALLVRAVTPAGFMLAAADAPSGRYLTVTFCEGHSTPGQVIDLDTGMPVDPASLATDDGKSNTLDDGPPCVFAGVAPYAPPVLATDAVVFISVQRVVFDVRETLRPGRGIPAPPPPSTGPPSSI